MIDPLSKAERADRELFNATVKLCEGAPRDRVVTVALNLLANALRQQHGKREDALASLDKLWADARELTAKNYTALGVRYNGAYPFDQGITVGVVDFNAGRKFGW